MSISTNEPHHLAHLARMPAPSEASFEHAAVTSLDELQKSVAELLAAAPGDTHRATDVGQVFGVDYRLAWQIFRIATVTPTIAAGINVPARVSIKKFLKAAEARQVPPDIVQRVARAFDDFEHLVDTHAGDRASLEAMLGALIPDEREKYDLASRQTIFKGVSQYKGVAAETSLSTIFYHPGSDETRLDRALMYCDFGLRRSKPDARIVIGIGELTGNTDTLTLDGQPTTGPLGKLLSKFSSSPLPSFETYHVGGMAYNFISGRDVGMRSAIDLVTAEYKKNSLPRYWQPGTNRVSGPTLAVDTPAKRMTMDVFIHKDVYPDSTPQLRVHDTACRGWVLTIDDPMREHDRLYTNDIVRQLSPGIAAARLLHVPRYTEMLEYLYTTLNWNPAEFRGYRLDVHYPMYGAQYTIGFALPEANQA